MQVDIELQTCCGNRSGVGTYTFELAKRLKNSADIEFHGYLFNFLNRHDYSPIPEELNIPVIEYHFMPYSIYRRIGSRIITDMRNRNKELPELSLFFNYLAPNAINNKYIITIYDMVYARFPETMEKKNYLRLVDNLKRSASKAVGIITISEFSKKEIMDIIGFPEERIFVIPCAPSISGEEFESMESIQGVYGITQPFILYMGTIEPRKNLRRVLEAYEYLKKEYNIPHKFVLAGGEGWKNKEIYSTAERIFGSEDVIFTGYVSEIQKNTLYKNASLFVYPSLYEGFGIPPLEAMYFGCPVVASNAASLPEIIGDAAYMADPLDKYSIAEGIMKTLYEDGYRKEMIERGKRRTELFSWDSSTQKLYSMCMNFR